MGLAHRPPILKNKKRRNRKNHFWPILFPRLCFKTSGNSAGVLICIHLCLLYQIAKGRARAAEEQPYYEAITLKYLTNTITFKHNKGKKHLQESRQKMRTLKRLLKI